MNSPEKGEVPIIGRDLPWDAIEGEFCRIEHFTPFAIVESGKVKSASSILPYASLRVELPNLNTHPKYQQKLKGITLPAEASMPVLHKLDFLNLWKIYNETQINADTMELIVVYAPLKRRNITNIFSSVLPSLVIQLHRKGLLERFYIKHDPVNVEEWFNSVHAIAEWDARPENLK